MAQRISRAKRAVRGTEFRRPEPEDRDRRLAAVLQVLYLIFNEGYTATAGPELHRTDLAREAIRLTRSVRRLLPHEGRVTGLLALMVLTEARTPARTGRDGELIPLDEQDRALWDRTAIAEGTALAEEALTQGPAGDYQLQAAIAALHDEAGRAEDTDWPQILALYELLVRRTPDPAAALGRAVAVAMVHGPRAGLAAVDALAGPAAARPGAGARAEPSAVTTGSTPYAPTSWSAPGSGRPRGAPTAQPPTARSANPRPGTCGRGRSGWTRNGHGSRAARWGSQAGRTGTEAPTVIPRAHCATSFGRSRRAHLRGSGEAIGAAGVAVGARPRDHRKYDQE